MSNIQNLTKESLGNSHFRPDSLLPMSIGFLTCFVNALILGISVKTGHKKKVLMKMLIGNLAITDILVGIQLAVMPIIIYVAPSLLTCYVSNAIIQTCVAMSVVTLCLISWERKVAVCNCTTYTSKIERRRIVFLVVLVGTWGGLLVTAVAKVCWQYVHEPNAPHDNCSLTLLNSSGSMHLAYSSGIAIGIAVQTYFYIRIGVRMKTLPPTSTFRAQLHDYAVAKKVFIILVIFYICYLPSTVIVGIKLLCKSAPDTFEPDQVACGVDPTKFFYTACLIPINSIANFFIFLLFSKTFRENLKTTLLWCRPSNQVLPGSSMPDRTTGALPARQFVVTSHM